jgi:predicted PhzF superfamily epimerase YddE/YHI9
MFTPATELPDAGVPVVGLCVMMTELYAPEHDNVVLVSVVEANTTVDVTTPSVYKLPAVPPVTVNGGPALSFTVYGTTVNGPYFVLLLRSV